MSLAAVLLSAAVASTQAAGAPDNRSPVRCPPTPYYINDSDETPVADRQSDQSKPTRLVLSEKRTRPCYLTRGQAAPSANRFRLI